MHITGFCPWLLALLGVVCGCGEPASAGAGSRSTTPQPGLPDAAAPALATQPRPAHNLSRGSFVSGGRLYDATGHDLVLRGVNHPLAWFPGDAVAWLGEVAMTGVNSVRLVWDTKSPVPLLQAAIARAIELKMVPMVELHDVTGSQAPADLLRMAQHYVGLRDVLLEFEEHLLINIANEWSGRAPIYASAYASAITLLRDAGIHHTLVIDANDWGQGIDSLLSDGPALLAGDPEHNLSFSVHMYRQHFADSAAMLAALRGAVDLELPFLVGEFGSAERLEDGGPGVIPFAALLEEAQRLQLGYLAWVWTGFGNGPASMDLSVDGSAAQLTSWGQAVIDGPFGIRQTSRAAGLFAD